MDRLLGLTTMGMIGMAAAAAIREWTDWPLLLGLPIAILAGLIAVFGSGPWWHKLAKKRGWPLYKDED
jgi:hypothetical protein